MTLLLPAVRSRRGSWCPSSSKKGFAVAAPTLLQFTIAAALLLASSRTTNAAAATAQNRPIGGRRSLLLDAATTEPRTTSAASRATVPPAALKAVSVLGPATMLPWATQQSDGNASLIPSGFDPLAKWIWMSPNAYKNAPTTSYPVFTTTLVNHDPNGWQVSAQLEIVVDDVAEVFLNGEFVGVTSATSAGWPNPLTFFQLQWGTNELWIRCTNLRGPAGLLASIAIVNNYNSYSDNPPAVLKRTDSSWKYWLAGANTPIRPVRVLSTAQQSTWPLTNIGPGKPFPTSQASWIWSQSPPGTPADLSAVATFFRTYHLPAPATAATDIYDISPDAYYTSSFTAFLHVMADDVADIYVNGVFIATVRRGWAAGAYTGGPLRVTLQDGANNIAIRCRNEAGPGGVLAALIADDTKATLLGVTDASWSNVYEPSAVTPAVELGFFGMDPWAHDYKTNVSSMYPDPAAAWIWTDPFALLGASTDDVPTFWKLVTLPAAVSAELWAIPDDELQAWVNGKFVGGINGGWWTSPFSNGPLPVKLSKGVNVISLRAINGGGPAGLLASLVSTTDGKVLARTDASWSFSVTAGDVLAGP